MCSDGEGEDGEDVGRVWEGTRRNLDSRDTHTNSRLVLRAVRRPHRVALCRQLRLGLVVGRVRTRKASGDRCPRHGEGSTRTESRPEQAEGRGRGHFVEMREEVCRCKMEPRCRRHNITNSQTPVGATRTRAWTTEAKYPKRSQSRWSKVGQTSLLSLNRPPLVARFLASLAVATMLRSALATSSRVGLDFTLPRAFSTSATVAAVARARKGVKEDTGPQFRWSPLDPSAYRRSTGQMDRAPTHLLSVYSSRNNTLLTLSDSVGPLFPTISGGSDKTFKKGQRSSYEAAHQAALKMFKKVSEFEAEARATRPTDRIWIKVAFKGLVGQGREAVSQALSGPDGADMRPLIVRVEDRTPFRIGGTRGRSPRRV